MGIWPHSLWNLVTSCTHFSPDQIFLLCNRCLTEDTCQSGRVSCYHTVYVTGRHYMCRNAATWRWSHSTKNIKNKMLLPGLGVGGWGGGGVFVFPWKERQETISSLLECLGTSEMHSSMQPELGLGPITWQCPGTAPASVPETGSGLRMVLLSADQHLWEPSLSVCGSAQRTK